MRDAANKVLYVNQQQPGVTYAIHGDWAARKTER